MIKISFLIPIAEGIVEIGTFRSVTCFAHVAVKVRQKLLDINKAFKMAFNINVKVRPVVLFQICDAYERRNMENHRVIGTLLGKSLIFKLLFGQVFVGLFHGKNLKLREKLVKTLKMKDRCPKSIGDAKQTLDIRVEQNYVWQQ